MNDLLRPPSQRSSSPVHESIVHSPTISRVSSPRNSPNTSPALYPSSKNIQRSNIPIITISNPTSPINCPYSPLKRALSPILSQYSSQGKQLSRNNSNFLLTRCQNCERVKSSPPHSTADAVWSHFKADGSKTKYSHGLCPACYEDMNHSPLVMSPVSPSIVVSTSSPSFPPPKSNKSPPKTSPTLIKSVSTPHIFHPHKVLVVDDDHILRKCHQKMVHKAGYLCDLAENGKEAIEMLRKADEYFLVLIDYHMGETDGCSTAQHIRNLEARQEISSPLGRLKIVAVTGTEDEDLSSKCFLAGMDGFEKKPLTANRLKILLDPQSAFVRSNSSKFG